eukprot:2563432-Pyramimonas_sp.AAC.1
MKEVLAPHVFDAYNKGIPDSQHGAVSGRGTDMAAFLLQCFVSYCDARGLSYFCLLYTSDAADDTPCVDL